MAPVKMMMWRAIGPDTHPWGYGMMPVAVYWARNERAEDRTSCRGFQSAWKKVSKRARRGGHRRTLYGTKTEAMFWCCCGADGAAAFDHSLFRRTTGRPGQRENRPRSRNRSQREAASNAAPGSGCIGGLPAFPPQGVRIGTHAQAQTQTQTRRRADTPRTTHHAPRTATAHSAVSRTTQSEPKQNRPKQNASRTSTKHHTARTTAQACPRLRLPVCLTARRFAWEASAAAVAKLA